MPTYELLVSDIDGTLTPTGGDPSYDIYPTQLAFAAARAQGKQISLATARPIEWTESIVAAFGVTTPIIVNNGARVSDPVSGKTLWERRLPEGAAENIRDFLGELSASQDITVNLDNGRQQAFRGITLGLMEDTVYFDLIGVGDVADTEAIAGFVDDLDNTTSVVVASPQLPGGYNVLITHEEGTKYHGFRALQEILELNQAQTIAVGNDINDAPLLAAAGIGAAVADADPRLIEKADMIVPSPYDYGVARLTMSHLITS